MILPRIPIPTGAALVVAACLAIAAADGLQRAVTAGGHAIEAAADLLHTEDD